MLGFWDILQIAGLVAFFEVVFVVPIGFYIGLKLFTFFLPNLLEDLSDDKEIIDSAQKALFKLFPSAKLLQKPPTVKQAMGLAASYGVQWFFSRFLGGMAKHPDAIETTATEIK